MDSVRPAALLNELQIPSGSSKPSGTGVPQNISSTTYNTAAIKLTSSVLISSLSDFSSDALHTPVPKPAITGVAVSPCGSMVAAYSTDALYVAQLNGDGQLQKAGQLAGIKAVHWCPGGAVLAVFCQQVDPFLLVLADQPGEVAPATPPLQRLTGPRSASFGARCATWLPRSSASDAAALLAAWPSDVLLYTWLPNGVTDWKHPKVHRFLAGWPGPARTLAAIPCTDSADSSKSSSGCLVLATVDAQLSLDTQDDCLLLQPQEQQQQQGGLARSISSVPPASPDVTQSGILRAQSGGVLSSLMNIHSTSVVPASTNGTASSANGHCNTANCGPMQLSSASLCMSEINPADIAAKRRPSSNGIKLSNGLPAIDTPVVSTLQLEQLPLPNLLTVQRSVVAVASSKGPPLVTLCSVSQGSGLQLLQTVQLPLPKAAKLDMSKARLEGLVLAAAATPKQQQQQHGTVAAPGRRVSSDSSNSGSNSSSWFPGVDLAGGGKTSALLTEPALTAQPQQQQQLVQQQGVQQSQYHLPDIVALMVCSSSQPQTGHFASFGSTATAAAAAAGETFMLKCRPPPMTLAQQQQLPNNRIASPKQQQSAAANGAHHKQHSPVSTSPRHHQQPFPAYPTANGLNRNQYVSPGVSPRQQQQRLISVLSPGHHAATPSPPQLSPAVTPRRQSTGCLMAAGADSPSKSPRGQQHQQQLQCGSDSSSSSLSAPSTPITVLHRCPWLRNMQLREQEEEQQAAAATAAAAEAAAAAAAARSAGSSDPRCSTRGLPQLETLQLQLDSLLQQQGAAAQASAAVSAKMVDCLSDLRTSVQQQAGSREYLDATVAAMGKMQCVMDSMLQSMQQQQKQQQPDGLAPNAAGEIGCETTAAAAFGKMQAAMECMLTAMQQQQQQATMHAKDTQPAAETAAAFGTLQASIERLTDALEQQQKQQQAALEQSQKQQAAVTAAALANLQVSLESRLDGILQCQQKMLQDNGHKDHALVSAMAQMQVSVERRLDAMHITLKDLVVKMAGLEEELAELEQQ